MIDLTKVGRTPAHSSGTSAYAGGPMARFHWAPRRSGVTTLDDQPASSPAAGTTDIVEPVIDTSDLSVLVRAFHGPDLPARPEPTATHDAQLTVSRFEGDIFADRQIYVFVDGEPWGKV